MYIYRSYRWRFLILRITTGAGQTAVYSKEGGGEHGPVRWLGVSQFNLKFHRLLYRAVYATFVLDCVTLLTKRTVDITGSCIVSFFPRITEIRKKHGLLPINDLLLYKCMLNHYME